MTHLKIFFILFLCIAAHNTEARRYVISDYQSQSLYTLSEEVFDTLSIAIMPENFPIKRFLKFNTKKSEIKSLTIAFRKGYNLSDELLGYTNLVSLEIRGWRCKIDEKTFISTIENIEALDIDIRGMSYDNLVLEASLLDHLLYLSITDLDLNEINFPTVGFNNLGILQISAELDSIDRDFLGYPSLNYVYMGKVRQVDMLLLDSIEKRKLNFTVEGLDLSKNLLLKATTEYRFVHLSSWYIESENMKKKWFRKWIRKSGH